MKDLLMHYTIEEIIMFIVVLALAFKGVLDFFDWGKDKMQGRVDKQLQQQEVRKEINDKLDKVYDMQVDQEKRMAEMSNAIDILMKSDKDDIKAWITEQHHKFCYEIKAIDYYSLESIERRFENYKKENGNSYVETLIQELQTLPKIETENIKHTMILDEQNHDM